jgi:hypothetical protein
MHRFASKKAFGLVLLLSFVTAVVIQLVGSMPPNFISGMLHKFVYLVGVSYLGAFFVLELLIPAANWILPFNQNN